MRVALITDGIWPYVLGGMQKHSYYLCKYLAQKKVQVDLFHFNKSEYDISKLEFFSEEEKKYISSYIVNFPKSAPFPGHYLYNSYKHSQLIYQAIQDKLSSYDLIYTKGFAGWHLINEKHNNKIKCAPIGVKFHGYEMFQKPPDFKIRLQHLLLLRKPVRELSLKADLVFSYGGKITEIIKSIGVKESNIVELPSGVEQSILADSIRPQGENIKFLFLGRYERRKGIEELNLAIQNFTKSSNTEKAEFHFVGPIPEDKRLKSKGVIYHGEIRDKTELQKRIREADVLICPSWSEGMPNVILEAMANGLAVIATDVGATNVMVSEKTGWLLKSSDSKEIQTDIEYVLSSDTTQLSVKKQNALNHIRDNFTWEKLIEKFYDRFFI
jgi:glycosyltransferase involved in cell wall biosynthesis